MKTAAAIIGVMVLSTGISNGVGTKKGASHDTKKAEPAASSASSPGPEVQKLGALVGTWKISGQMQKSPMGPAGKTSATETCAWFEGEYFVVCRMSGTTP